MKHQYSETGLEVAIVGMAGEFPEADSLESFWSNLCTETECIRFFDPDDLVAAGIPEHVVRDESFVPAKGVVPGLFEFDAEFFGYSAREASVMDPQMRRFHQLAWHALENAGYAPDAPGCSVGIWAGAGDNSIWISRFLREMSNSFARKYEISTLTAREFLCTRIAYKLNLKGPAVTVQTACSTSLVALHSAVTALLAGECDMSLAGAVAIHPNDVNGRADKGGYSFQEGMILSPDGHCRPFDIEAQGTIPGDGLGMVVLKRLDDARRDNDTILAVIKGTAINNDGNLKAGFTAPSVDGQSRVIHSAMRAAEVEPETISYIEAHGTGTPLGDPIEIEALGRVFGKTKENRRIGSVKSNIGHLDAAAGMAGLIKTVLAMRHKLLPPNLHYNKANPKANLLGAGFNVNSELTSWNNEKYPLRACVSSFGIGGTNAHTILEEYLVNETTECSSGWKILPWSAKSEESLNVWSNLLADHLESEPALRLNDCAYTLSTGRSHFEHRRILITDSREKAISILREESSPHILSGRAGSRRRKITFLFPGQGSQYAGMGADIYHQLPEYREHVDSCLSLLAPSVCAELKPFLTNSEATEQAIDISNTRLAQPLLFIVEYALAQTFISWGIEPDNMIGHSIGEYVAACVSGAIPLSEALEIVVQRGSLMAEAEPGAMLAVNLDHYALKSYLSHELELAAINSSDLSVVSGTISAIEHAQVRLETEGVSVTRLKVSHGYHSHLMEPVLDRFSAVIQDRSFNDINIPYYSNISGQLISTKEIKQTNYWIQHLRSTVNVANPISEALDDEERIFLEVGPGRTLTTFVRKHSKFNSSNRLINTIPPGNTNGDNTQHLLMAISKLYLAGVSIDWKNFYHRDQNKRIPLPGYVFKKTEFIPEPIAEVTELSDLAGDRRVVRLYEPHWQRRPISLGDLSRDRSRTYIIFRDTYGLTELIEQQLINKGCRVIPVEKGEAFNRTADGAYTVGTGNAHDYTLLIEEIGRLQIEVHEIIHAWSVDRAGNKSTNELSEDSFYSLLNLAKALAELSTSENVLISILATELFSISGDEDIVASKALLTGPLRVIPHEVPHLNTRVIEFNQNALERSNNSELLRSLVRELETDKFPQQVAYRGRNRWVREYRPIPANKEQAKSSEGVSLRIGGTYLITGGLGDIGIAKAKHIAKNGPVNLILTTRRPISDWRRGGKNPSHTISSSIVTELLELEKSGTTVDILTADVTSHNDMVRIRRHIESVFGVLNGIVHCAGLPGDGSLLRKEREAMDAVLAPKTIGATILSKTFCDMDLDFVLFCSSITAILGGFGQVDYCAANAYLDAFALNSGFNNRTRVISVNWDTWSGMGMAAQDFKRKPKELSEMSSSGKLLSHDQHKFVFSQILSANDTWALREHWILGKATLPGAFYIDAATSALKLAGYTGELKFSDILFLSPLLLNENEATEIKLKFQRNTQGFEFTAESSQAHHVRGQVAINPQSLPIAQGIDIPKLRSLCSERVIDDAMEIAHLGKITSKVDGTRQSELVEFGPRWKNIQEIRLEGGRGLARMRLSDEYIHDLTEHRLHPALLDVATAFLRPFHQEGIFLPLSYGKLTLYKDLPQSFYSYAKLSTSGGSNDKGILDFDIEFYSEDGNVIAVIEHFTLREINQESIRAAAANGNRNLSEEQNNPLVTSGLSLEEGLNGFDQVLTFGAPSVAVAYEDIDPRITRYDNFLKDKSQHKIQRSARPDLASAYVKPKSKIEIALAEIWEELLAIDGIGIYDNFFELGGDSLLLVQLHKLIKAQLSTQLSITELYDFPTITTLAQAMETPREEKNKQKAEATRVRAKQQKAARARRKPRKN
ncbi:type I polyketide synthase [Microbulbifer sp. GL-2]|uniref:type I polyketide synthase n=1 Tax=Microbulbifer sp. GL-2 TaxID=2591606 RepID=UPI0011646198|nr:type I polyketide synthase [Microbulbifer sp. GL-2]BBM00784.1 hypothetical protein GL2_08580 [Microbulbifer sp. GL-2]